MENLRVVIVQQDIIWENTFKNVERLDQKIKALKEPFDLVVLCEMFHCGFSMNPSQVALATHNEVNAWMQKVADDNNCAIMGSLAIADEGGFYNRLYIHANGHQPIFYNKRHLFRMGGEHHFYKSGTKSVIKQYKGWRIKPMVCYDLRFPVWSRNRNNYDVLVYVANWPDSRREVWQTLLKARAIENQCYVIGVNRVGHDNTHSYAGDSMVISPKGDVICELQPYAEGVGAVSLSMPDLLRFREQFPVWEDADDFSLE